MMKMEWLTTARPALQHQFGIVWSLGGRVLHWPRHWVQRGGLWQGAPLHLGGRGIHVMLGLVRESESRESLTLGM